MPCDLCRIFHSAIPSPTTVDLRRHPWYLWYVIVVEANVWLALVIFSPFQPFASRLWCAYWLQDGRSEFAFLTATHLGLVRIPLLLQLNSGLLLFHLGFQGCSAIELFLQCLQMVRILWNPWSDFRCHSDSDSQPCHIVEDNVVRDQVPSGCPPICFQSVGVDSDCCV